ncbi:hypothetical protein VIGAN_08078300 [Vigna angularis var. angularis]|uniref:Uncharacterized protein n=1 Tax=Vigna angularis var. angularis TaxID=157739 RepID=A0A0S3SMX8_PHAAN|nr:hypothetical protein VIGAN_08078300 [Vigna angularis var. angularis]
MVFRNLNSNIPLNQFCVSQNMGTIFVKLNYGKKSHQVMSLILKIEDDQLKKKVHLIVEIAVLLVIARFSLCV